MARLAYILILAGVLTTPALAQAPLRGLTARVSSMCLKLEDMRYITSEYQHGSWAGNAAFLDMVDGGRCAFIPGGIEVRMKEPVEKATVSEPFHIWRGEVNGTEVYMLISDDFKLPGRVL